MSRAQLSPNIVQPDYANTMYEVTGHTSLRRSVEMASHAVSAGVGFAALHFTEIMSFFNANARAETVALAGTAAVCGAVAGTTEALLHDKTEKATYDSLNKRINAPSGSNGAALLFNSALHPQETPTSERVGLVGIGAGAASLLGSEVAHLLANGATPNRIVLAGALGLMTLFTNSLLGTVARNDLKNLAYPVEAAVRSNPPGTPRTRM